MRLLIATGLYPPEIGGPATYAKLFEERLPGYGIEVTVLPFQTVRHLPPILRHAAYCWRVIRSARHADAILVQDTVSTGLPVAIAALLLRKKFILRVPGDYAWEQGVQRFGVGDTLDDFQSRSYGIAVALLRAVQRFTVSRATRVIAPSKYLANIVSGWVSNEVDVVYNGIVLSERPSPLKEKNLIVSSGRLVPWKGFNELIDIVSKHPEWRLKIFGDGPERDELQERVRAMRAEQRIELRGSVPRAELLRAFAEASVFVLNSRYEGLSHTLVEAMSVGTPVVATNVGGNPEVVSDGEHGLLLDANDSAALEHALTRLMADEELRGRLGMAAAKRAEDFSIDMTVEATARLIHDTARL